MKINAAQSLACAFVLLLLGLPICPSAHGQELRWKLQTGDKFQLQMKQQTKSVVTLSSKKVDSTVDLLVNVSWDVQTADDDTFAVEQTIDSVRIEMKGADQNAVVYDSRERKALVGAAKELAGALSPLLGVKYKLTMNAQGAISAAERVTERAALVPGGEPGKAALLSQESIEQLLLQPMLPLPKEPLGSEQSWTDEKVTKVGLGQVKLTRTFKLAGTEERAGHEAVKIGVQGELEISAPVKGSPTLKEQSHTGTVWFTKEPGRLLAAETNQRIVTTSMYRDSTITVDLTTKLNTTLTPRD